jgi:hypothetical protein
VAREIFHKTGNPCEAGYGLRIEVEMNPWVRINDLTDERRIEPVVGNATLNGVPVGVEAAGA